MIEIHRNKIIMTNTKNNNDDEEYIYKNEIKINETKFLQPFVNDLYNKNNIGISFYYKFNGNKPMYTVLLKNIDDIKDKKIIIGKFDFSPDYNTKTYKFTIRDYISKFGRPNNLNCVCNMELINSKDFDNMKCVTFNEGIYYIPNANMSQNRLEQSKIIEEYLSNKNVLSFD